MNTKSLFSICHMVGAQPDILGLSQELMEILLALSLLWFKCLEEMYVTAFCEVYLLRHRSSKTWYKMPARQFLKVIVTSLRKMGLFFPSCWT